MRVWDVAASTPWIITEPALRQILEIAARENLSPDAVAAKLGRPLDNTRTVTQRQGVAIIPVDGPIFRKANLFTEVSGGTSTDVLATDITHALNDPSVHALLLEIDSPGGEATGINELSNMIYAARGTKPITAYVDGMAASAAYWIASACDEIVCDATAALGSIGVVMAVRDPSKQSSKEIEFVSSQSPNKRPDPTLEAGKAQLQTLVDHMADVFVAAVARNRDVGTDTVLSDFGAGGLFVGEHAVTAGLANRIGSFETTLAQLAAWDVPSQSGSMRSLSMHQQQERSMSGKDEQPQVQAVNDQELHELRAQLAAEKEKTRVQAELLASERERAIVSAAETFVLGEITANRLLPAQKSVVSTLYTILARDDATTPVLATFADGMQGGRVDGLRALVAAQRPHQLTKEHVQVVALSNTTASSQDDELAKVRAGAKAQAEQSKRGN